jgi:hypothetical protein
VAEKSRRSLLLYCTAVWIPILTSPRLHETERSVHGAARLAVHGTLQMSWPDSARRTTWVAEKNQDAGDQIIIKL